MKIDQALRIALDATDAQPNTMECPDCFAIVRKARLADHQRSAHGKAGT